MRHAGDAASPASGGAAGRGFWMPAQSCMRVRGLLKGESAMTEKNGSRVLVIGGSLMGVVLLTVAVFGLTAMGGPGHLAVAGQLLDDVALSQILGSTCNTGPCSNTGDCSRTDCDSGKCSYCSGSGQDQSCVGMNSTPCDTTTTQGGCGTWQIGGYCDDGKCNGGQNSDKDCPRTQC